jgi:hypothetical protein
MPLRHQPLERQDALARELDDPALRTFVLRPGLHVPVARIVERGIFRVQVETGLPAVEQGLQLFGICHAPKSSARLRRVPVTQRNAARQHASAGGVPGYDNNRTLLLMVRAVGGSAPAARPGARRTRLVS